MFKSGSGLLFKFLTQSMLADDRVLILVALAYGIEFWTAVLITQTGESMEEALLAKYSGGLSRKASGKKKMYVTLACVLSFFH